jgi:hypothetical protein
VTNALKEVEVDLGSDVDRQELHDRVNDLLGAGEGVLWLTEKSGREVGIPVRNIAYVDFGRPSAQRSIGFSG